MLVKAFPFPIKTIQTDNGTEFTYKFVSEVEKKSGGKAVGEMGYQTYSDSADNAVAQWQGGAQSPQRPTVFLRLGAFLQRRRTE